MRRDQLYFHTIGQILKQKRVAARITQLDLGKMLGYPNSQSVSNWERGLSAPPTYLLPTLCRILGIERDQMIVLIMEETRRALENEWTLHAGSELKA